MMKSKSENDLLFTLDVHVSKQFLGWIFSLGEQVKIISPDEVVEQMKREIERLKSQYND